MNWNSRKKSSVFLIVALCMMCALGAASWQSERVFALPSSLAQSALKGQLSQQMDPYSEKDTLIDSAHVSNPGSGVNPWLGKPDRFVLQALPVIFTQIELHPNIETIGVVVNGMNLPGTAQLHYRRSDEENWRAGHPLMRIDDGRLVGSLFGLIPETTYEVKVQHEAVEISGLATTQPTELQFTPSVVLHVDNDALPGGDGSAVAPFQTIQEGINHAGPGAQILVADGIYHEALIFPQSGSAGNWIQVKAAGSGAILDGSKSLNQTAWTLHEKKNIWFTKVEISIEYLARDQKRFYLYDDLSGLVQGRGHDNVPMNEGWYLERSTMKLYVRLSDHPSSHTWQAPDLDHAFDVLARDWLWIEGFEIRFYGRSDGCGVCALNASHIVIRNNRIHNMQKGVFIEWTGGEERGNDTRIEYNEIYDPSTSEWAWNAVKGTSMESTGIIIRGHVGAIVRDNEVHHFFNGIYTGSSGALENPELAFDADIYNNRIHHIYDDGLEPEGACINHRFRNNSVDSSFVGISLAPVTLGPTWVLRSLITNYTGRSVKWDRDSDGIVILYHNTSWTSAMDPSAMILISPANNGLMRNNIFQGNGYAIEEVDTGSTGHDWNYDNWYTTRSNPRFKWENINYDTLVSLCAATGYECNGHELSPGLANPGGGDFTLLPSSPNIDRGIVIPGINDDFSGGAPDIGANEYEYAVDTIPVVASIMRSDASPTPAASVNFTVNFSEAVTGVDLLPPFSDFVLTTGSGITGAMISNVTPVSETTYIVGVNTGIGNGEIRLDVMDDNSIVDATGNPLGGQDLGDGSFITGETYTISRSAPFPMNIQRANPDPTSASNVNFIVAFSESVAGIDSGDFSLSTVGAINNAYVVNISGSGNTYMVEVNTGSGDGGLRLDLLDDDSVLGVISGNPLGGVGIGNGGFTEGEAYTIDKTAPIVTGSMRADPDPSSAQSVHFAVVFSEPVSGINAYDFALTATGNLSGATIEGVSGDGYLYIITASTGSGNGTLHLDILDDDSIIDSAGSPLGGVGIGNGNFTIGETYTISKISAPIISTVFRSNGKNDGWVLESNEFSNKGGWKNSNAATLNLGDDSSNRQFRAVLHFPTASLPNNAIITKAVLMIKKQGMVGIDPFTTHQNIIVDIRSGAFDSASLQPADFQNPASKELVAIILNYTIGGWYWSELDSAAFRFINLKGNTQFRLRFQLEDNDDMGDDYLKFYSGNYDALADRPHLVIEYYLRK